MDFTWKNLEIIGFRSSKEIEGGQGSDDDDNEHKQRTNVVHLIFPVVKYESF